MRSCTTRTLHVSRAIAILGYAAQVSVRAGSVIAHLASLNRYGPKLPFTYCVTNGSFETVKSDAVIYTTQRASGG
ncbi:hypothetical protein GGR95_003168 [Sulfitobacter undariae]|uniref:Uncharacterized protein n=1 Tax=Sulfitobacter undariae TaxID=1563671 RepID=A0A7W6E681_9RHOB|nr:hypothetical protein [Sulfitobacter undariae]